MADITDASLVNPWGMAQGSATPAWVSDNGTNVSTLYRGDGVVGPPQKVPLTVSIPGDGPTGQVFNPSTSDFVVSDGNGHSGPAAFIFDSESGDITGWSPAVPPPPPSTQASERRARRRRHLQGAGDGNRRGCVVPLRRQLPRRHHRRLRHDLQAGEAGRERSRDPHLPKHYAPFNIASLNGKLYVSYAQQDADAEDEVDGFGRGLVDVFDTSGHFVRRLISLGHLNAPWGMTLAPDNFGKFSGDLLVGNFGNGRIHAYDPTTGRFKGTLKDANQKPIVIDGLWGLMFGNGVSAGADDAAVQRRDQRRADTACTGRS